MLAQAARERPRPFPPDMLSAETSLSPSIEDYELGPSCSNTAECAKGRSCHGASLTCEVPCSADRECSGGLRCVHGACLRSKDGHAGDLADEALRKLNAKDFRSAVELGERSLAENPKRPTTLCTAYRAVGYGAAYLNDKAKAVRYLTKLQKCAK
jgi:hypothetical protein